MSNETNSYLEKAVPVEDAMGLWMHGHAIVQYWERPIMKQLALFCTERRGRVLEIGYGLGLSAQCIFEFGTEEHVIVEANPVLAKRAEAWAENLSGNRPQIVRGWWESDLSGLGTFDAILFDASPPGLDVSKNHYKDFIPIAPELLNEGGRLTYVSLETRKFSSDHIDRLLGYFNRVDLVAVNGLAPPPSCSYWTHDHMVLPCAIL